MFPLHMPKINIKRVLFFSLVASIFLTSCPPQIPVKVTDVSTSSPPIVGKFVDLHVELTSDTDEPNVIVSINLPPPIYSKDQEHRWELSLKEDEPVTLSAEMCVIEAGMWAISISIMIYSEDGLNMGGDTETIGVTAKAESGEVLPEREISFDIHRMTEEAHEFNVKIDPSECTYETVSTSADGIDSGTLVGIIGLSLLLVISAGYLLRRVFRGKQDELQ